MHRTTRRDYLAQTGMFAAGMLGINAFDVTPLRAANDPNATDALTTDPQGLINLPPGFSYTAFSRTGNLMDDGLKVPGAHDGMGAFPGPRGTTILVRNHELKPEDHEISAHLLDRSLTRKIHRKFTYDHGRNKLPAVGGTTTLVYDTKQQKLLRHFLSLTGTTRNCAGGTTPWGTWLTCEETVDRRGDLVEQDHGYVFEVPAGWRIRLADPMPYRSMGRFNHEAVAVDPRTKIVYQTEDRDDGLIYRFLPAQPVDLRRGGTLQALHIQGQGGLSTRNWSGEPSLPVRQVMEVDWVDIKNVEAPNDDLRYQGAQQKRAAIFARGEGMWAADGFIYWACTNGGPNKKGQIFRYQPSTKEGHPEERTDPGQLEIFSQPNDARQLEMADNLTVAPWGDVILCEDGKSTNHLVGITPRGRLYPLALNVLNDSEFAGSTFSPDGSTLFVNIQTPGITLAITGPWRQLGGGRPG